jgi:hypothetical protein
MREREKKKHGNKNEREMMIVYIIGKTSIYIYIFIRQSNRQQLSKWYRHRADFYGQFIRINVLYCNQAHTHA